MLELYNFSQSTCSQKVRICLAEKKLDWLDRRLLSKERHHISQEYLKLNPNGVVPTLVHDGVPIIESSVILQYLDDAFPEPPLAPRDPKTAARMRAWLAFFDQVPTPAVRYPSFQYGGLIKKFQTICRAKNSSSPWRVARSSPASTGAWDRRVFRKRISMARLMTFEKPSAAWNRRCRMRERGFWGRDILSSTSPLRP